jgi:drug/metabolite transporter (DMT)-like permease
MTIAREPEVSVGSGQARPSDYSRVRQFSELGIAIIFAAAEQIFLKLASEGANPVQAVFFMGQMASVWMWLGIGCLIGGLFFWLSVLRSMPLLIAFNLAAVTHVLVPLGSWLFLGEQISMLRWAGILLVTSGVLIVAQPLAKVEERL